MAPADLVQEEGKHTKDAWVNLRFPMMIEYSYSMLNRASQLMGG
jgi:hypothetical protein